MIFRITYIAILLIGTSFIATAQMKMKSCCEAPGVHLVSTVKQSKGTLKMIYILDSIVINAKPEDLYVLNTLRAEIAKKKLLTEKDPNKRFLLYFEYCVESLNAGNYDEAIAGNAMNARPDLPSVTLRSRNGKENFSPFRKSHIGNFNVGPANRE